MSLVGKTIRRYRVIEQLGQGGMAVVYKASDERLGREVAIKVIRTETVPPIQLERLLKRFEREAKAQAQFEHSNIVTVYDYGEYKGSPYLVMAYRPGGTLKARIGKLVNYVEAAGLLAPVADALAYAHRRDVLHRDVKPSNILMSEEGVPCLTDFGIAKLLGEVDEATLTGTGMGVGTPQYMAPEQWMGKPVPQTDIYALGVVFYELVTGRKPYDADTPAALVLLQANEPLPRPSMLVSKLPEHVEKVIYKALAKEPADRYASMAEFGQVLAELTQQGTDLRDKDLAQIEGKQGRPSNEYTKLGVKASISQRAKSRVRQFDQDKTFDDLLTEVRSGDEKSKRKRLLGQLPGWVLGLVAGVVLIGVLVIGVVNGQNRVSSLVVMATETPTATRSPTAILISVAKTTPTTTIGLTSTANTVREKINPTDGAVAVFVPAGVFTMGSDDGDLDESPAHDVYLDSFWLYKYEVTMQQYVDFMNVRGNQVEGGVPWIDHDVNSFYGGAEILLEQGEWVLGRYNREKYPVRRVSWFGAVAYCEWAGGRLPTEAEWEKAARGTDGRTYPWGNTRDNIGYSYQLPPYVGSFPEGASPYGALDMAGSVWEWVSDWYDPDYYQNSPTENPQGPETGVKRVLRGGYTNVDSLRAANRFFYDPIGEQNLYIGIRCVLEDE